MNTPSLDRFVKGRVRRFTMRTSTSVATRQGGWRATPALDRRRVTETPPARPAHRCSAFARMVIAVLLLNVGAMFAPRPGAPTRVKVPFNPYFLNEVQSGGVSSSASIGDTIQATFVTAVR
jgi:hypothetical protein